MKDTLYRLLHQSIIHITYLSVIFHFIVKSEKSNKRIKIDIDNVEIKNKVRISQKATITSAL